MTTTAMTIPGILKTAASRHGGRIAVEDGARRVSFVELEGLAHAAASAYLQKGIQPGDRVAIWAPNSVEWIVAALGAHCAGAALVPMNTRLKGREAGDILRRSGARALTCPNEFLGTRPLDLLRNEPLPELSLRIVLPDANAPAPMPASMSPDTLPFDEYIASGSACPPPVLDRKSVV